MILQYTCISSFKTFKNSEALYEKVQKITFLQTLISAFNQIDKKIHALHPLLVTDAPPTATTATFTK